MSISVTYLRVQFVLLLLHRPSSVKEVKEKLNIDHVAEEYHFKEVLECVGKTEGEFAVLSASY